MVFYFHELFKVLIISTLHKVTGILFDIEFCEFLQMCEVGNCSQDTEQVQNASKNSLWSKSLPVWQPMFFSVSVCLFSPAFQVSHEVHMGKWVQSFFLKKIGLQMKS